MNEPNMETIKVYPGVPGMTWHETQGDKDIDDSEIIYTFCVSEWDDLFTNHPDFFVTDRLKKAFEKAGVKGCRYVKISHAEDKETGKRLDGNFFVLKCDTDKEAKDVAINSGYELVLSLKAVAIVKHFRCEWVSFGAPHDFLLGAKYENLDLICHTIKLTLPFQAISLMDNGIVKTSQIPYFYSNFLAEATTYSLR